MKHQMTGNAGLFHIAWELTRRGWIVMPTVRNARGADLYAAPIDNEDAVIPIQSIKSAFKTCGGSSWDRFKPTSVEMVDHNPTSER
ncbi:hypothetical protein [Cohaesibacter intestini]|uniref:hypothetical protein n=1 Tax=Cohaesibacter intestini TaxID=2211145 RepID=UPI001FE0406B|nr:hypothetical protein [Cohaesibacter intestini]